MYQVHVLKTLPLYFNQTLDGNKPFEIRLNDRYFQVGDYVLLAEWDGVDYSGRKILGRIEYILSSDDFVGLSKGYVAFSFEIFKIFMK